MKKNIELTPDIETLFGTRDENLHVLEDGLNINIDLRSDRIELEGAPRDVARAEQLFADYEHLRKSGHQFVNGDLSSMLRVVVGDPNVTLRGLAEAGRQRSFGRRTVQPKSPNQRRYLEAIEQHDMVFGVGPAGTGKTYLAVAMAISALLNKQVNRIILARPAVEAGERLGFLPGTLQEKIDPYLRPLYDALFDMLDPERVERYLEKNVIEIAPIAFMRGRTLNDSFVILDEAQNTTSEQMKMFVTRLGFGSKAVITGDVTQIDLPNARRSGLIEAVDILQGVNGLAFVHFDEAMWCVITWCSASSARTTNTRTKLAEQQMSLLEPKPVAPPSRPCRHRPKNHACATRNVWRGHSCPRNVGGRFKAREQQCPRHTAGSLAATLFFAWSGFSSRLREKRGPRITTIAIRFSDAASLRNSPFRGCVWRELNLVIFEKRVAGLTELALARFVARARRAAGLHGAVNVLLTSSSAMKSLNRRFRRKDKPTDVLDVSRRARRPKTIRGRNRHFRRDRRRKCARTRTLPGRRS
jgi:phosphate starvation-inducible PhoH-like protein